MQLYIALTLLKENRTDVEELELLHRILNGTPALFATANINLQSLSGLERKTKNSANI